MHTIIPGMLTQGGHAVMPFGVMGGHFQPVGQSLLLTNMFDYGMDVQAALDLPRVMPQLGDVYVEHGVPVEARKGLAARGHHVVEVAAPHGGGAGDLDRS